MTVRSKDLRLHGAALLCTLLMSAGAYACTLVMGDGAAAPKHAHAHARKANEASGEKAVAPFWVGPGHTGSWFNPARAGEGWTLEMLPDGSVAVVWYTFLPGEGDTGQAWVLGQGGVVEGNRIRFTTVYTARGGRFGPTFDPAAVVLEPWGTLEFTFTSCDAGTMSYTGPAAYGSGSHPIARLIAVRELGCAGERLRNATGSRAAAALRAFSGSWLDPTHGGEGWVVEALSATTAGVYWFTYTPDGTRQAWLLGLGTMDGDRLVIPEMQRPVGTAFGDAFDPGDVRREAWGSLTFQFTGCNTASVTYASTQPGYGSGALNAVRLTALASATCLDAIAPPAINGQWSQVPVMPLPASELATAVLGTQIYVAGSYVGLRYFQRFDTATSQWTTLPELPGGRDHAEAIGYDGKIWLFGGVTFAGPDATSPAFVFDVAANTWQPVPQAPYVGASGGALLNGYFYLGSDDGTLVQFDPRSRLSRRIPAMNNTIRDHSQLVAYLGEIWLLGGRSQQTGEQIGVTIFDPVSETWRRGPNMRAAHAGFAAGVVNDQIIAAGGEIVYGTPRDVVSRVDVISPGAESWVRGPDLPRAIHGVGGAVVGGKFYAVGGSISAGGANNPGVTQVYQP
jgi:hypothetical protein